MILRTKLTLGTLILLESVIGLGLAVNLRLERRHLEKRQRAGQEDSLRRFAQVCRDSALEKNDLIALHYMKALKTDPAVRYSVFVDAQNKVRLHSDMLGKDPAPLGSAWDFTGSSGGPQLSIRETLRDGLAVQDYSTPVYEENRWLGTAVIGYDSKLLDSATEADLWESASRFIVAALVISGLGLLGAMLLAWHLNRPILDLDAALKRVGEGDFHSQLSPTTKDELAGLVGSFNLMSSRLNALEEFREQMASGVSHDLRAPVSAISGYVQILREQAKERLAPVDEECLDAISQSAGRLSTMSQDLLDLAKLKAGQLPLRKSATRLTELAEEARKLTAPLSQELKVAVAIDISPEFPAILMDASLILRVLVNLITNSLRYTQEGGTILVTAVQREAAGEVSVVDTGIGIPPEQLPRLFSRFLQIPEHLGASRKGMGTGLGLSICREIVSAHGGSIWATSVQGSGTTVHFSLPIS